MLACILVLLLAYSVDGASVDRSHTVTDFYDNKITNLSNDNKSLSIEEEAFINKIPPLAGTAVPTEEPSTVLNEIYSDCLVKLSFSCLQKKVLIFLDRIGRLDKFSLIDGVLYVERIGEDNSQTLTESTLSPRRFQDEQTLNTLIDLYVERFFENHLIKVNIPAALEVNGRTTTLDIKIGDNVLTEGRKKGGGGGKMKGMKKMMMMMGMMMIMKMSLLGPMMMGLIGIAALKALVFSVISITISKIMILKKLKMMMGSKGGGGGGDSNGWASSGGGSNGWDRGLDSHQLSYSAHAI